MMKSPAALILFLSLGLTPACKHAPQPEASQATDVLSSVPATPPPAPLQLVHGSFKLATTTKFEFEVPAHCPTPKLEGSFAASDAGTPESPGNIDLLIMTPDEFDDFTHGHGGTASYSVTGSSGQTVSYALPSTLDSPQKYFLVFRNPAGKNAPKTVKTEVTASF